MTNVRRDQCASCVSQSGFTDKERDEDDEATAVAVAHGIQLDPVLTLELHDVVLLFETFPEKSHTGLAIETWIQNGLTAAGLEKADIALTVPDGAANGLRALRAMGLPYEASGARAHARTHASTPMSTTVAEL